MITELPTPSALRRFRKAELLEIQRTMALRCGYSECDETDTKEKIARFIETHWQAYQAKSENERIDEITPDGVWFEKLDTNGDGTDNYHFLPHQPETDMTPSTAAERLDRPSAFRCYRDLLFLEGNTGDSRFGIAAKQISSYLRERTGVMA